MSEHKTSPGKNTEPHERTKGHKVLYLGFALIFAALLVLVGVISNQFAARQQSVGFPGLDTTSFTLTSHEGDSVKNTDLIGKPTVIYFGFTYCPDVCPTTLSLLADLVEDTGAAEAFQLVLITVDPARDTPDVLKEYLSLFDADILGLTGSEAEISQVVKQFGIYRAPADDGLGNETIDHTSSVFLYYAYGKMKGTISPAEPYAFARQKLVDLKQNAQGS